MNFSSPIEKIKNTRRTNPPKKVKIMHATHQKFMRIKCRLFKFQKVKSIHTIREICHDTEKLFSNTPALKLRTFYLFFFRFYVLCDGIKTISLKLI